ncbi:hypothetical protein SERLA73DRAFT_184292 [Serpula lacrymans var. lacrymans S7.3]|uniref:Uncharacterized protein n=1 Tax=Serpula lacrymans var. lacrymans (strain S7.3) TaxID=936435 RepID=F8Q2Y4_SERL3|nr:hypothetical protein SERLA73DRAFT_184292 [Serpula lacrymans var. lacrymans S7.3]
MSLNCDCIIHPNDVQNHNIVVPIVETGGRRNFTRALCEIWKIHIHCYSLQLSSEQRGRL